MISSSPADPTNLRLLAVAEDRLDGFYEQPFRALSERSDIPEAEVRERIIAMMRAGVVRAVRQTVPSSVQGVACLVAWKVASSREKDAFDWLAEHDPATGHIALREPELPSEPGADYRLWTTLRLPRADDDLQAHCRRLASHIGAEVFACMPAVGMFRLSVGHVRRAGVAPGTLEEKEPGMQLTRPAQLTETEQRVIAALRSPLSVEELEDEVSPWRRRAEMSGESLADLCRVAQSLAQRRLLGRFAVILEHTAAEVRVAAGTGAAALLMWRVQPGLEERAGGICAQHVCMTHCYWRSGTDVFGGAQIMGMVHATDREGVLMHKAAIDAQLERRGIRVTGTQVMHTVRARVRTSLLDFPAVTR